MGRDEKRWDGMGLKMFWCGGILVTMIGSGFFFLFCFGGGGLF